MRILVTGATGFVGRAAVTHLIGRGATVVALSREPDRARRLVPSLSEVFPWSMGEGVPPEALSGVQGVVHLAGESVAGRWTKAKMDAIHTTRSLGTRELVEAMSRMVSKPRVFVCASAVGYYGDRSDDVLTEESEPGDDFLARVCRDWEAEAVAAEELGIRTVRLRTGIVLGPAGGALKTLLLPACLGLGGPLGSGRQWWSWIHIDDLVHLVAHALHTDVSGALNATAPQPVRQREFARTLGRMLKRPAFLPAPALALKALLGGFSIELLGSKRVLPTRTRASGFEFQFPNLKDALTDLLI